MKDITVNELLNLKNGIPVDVRSPGEFKEAAIPGAINIPIFSDEERIEVGTIYKQQGPDTAKWRAMEIVSPKLPNILGEIRSLKKGNNQPVLYCWRGGMRSGSIASFLELAGIESLRLSGGYRAYREYILDKIPSLIPEQAVVLHGMTGTGKTDILIRLMEKGYPILDLEKIAAHRGSLFGSIGFETDGHNQKTFDSLLFERLRTIKNFSYFIVEAESQRIGKAGQPEELYEKKLNGLNLYMEASVPIRINRIYNEYVRPNVQEQWFYEIILEKVTKLNKRFKNKEMYQILLESARNKDYHEVIRILLEYYYDPRYQFKQQEYKNNFLVINADNLDNATEEIEKYINTKFPDIDIILDNTIKTY